MTVVRVDGGICSQINFVSYGHRLQREGRRVKFDLRWFADNGRDLNGQHVRNWDMPKAFPGLDLQVATDDEIAEAQCAGTYIGGYPTSGTDVLAALDLLRDAFRPQLGENDRKRLDRIASGKSCAVHVRRGDLSTYDPCYGRPASVLYFLEAVRLIRTLEGDVTFYFFSDDLQWVRENIASALDGVRVELCEGNGSDKGYVDLYLMAQCDNVISSGGSLGVVAAVLSSRAPRLVISRYRDWVCREIPRVIYLNDDVGCVVQKSVPLDQVVQYRKHGLYKPLYKIFKHLEKKLRKK